MRAAFLAVGAFVAMEPVTYATHRWVMHGIGIVLHRSHHRTRSAAAVEANDWFPVMFATVVMAAMAVGFNVRGWGSLVPVCIGITLYGVAYALVHDVYVHGRLPLLRGRRVAVFERLADAHRLHHRFNSEPYGMLLPIVPKAIQARAARSGSTPSHVPAEA